jgi:hypothetical protein
MSNRYGFSFLPVTIFAMMFFLSTPHQSAPLPAPSAEVQSQSFSITASSALTATGVQPADVLGIGGTPLIPCENLGLLCTDLNSGAADEIAGLSFGVDFTESALPPIQFSVDGASRGVAGSAVRAEATCSPAQTQADVFESELDGANSQDLDGDGIACAGNGGYGLSLSEGIITDALSSLDRDPCQFVDLNCDGTPEQAIYLTLVAGSPTLALLGATSADILASAAGFIPSVWANGITSLGLQTGDVIDALCLYEDGDGIYSQNDLILFSLGRASPTLAKLGAGPADLLIPAPPRLAISAALLGLEASDNINALSCTQPVTLHTLRLPIIAR